MKGFYAAQTRKLSDGDRPTKPVSKKEKKGKKKEEKDQKRAMSLHYKTAREDYLADIVPPEDQPEKTSKFISFDQFSVRVPRLLLLVLPLLLLGVLREV